MKKRLTIALSGNPNAGKTTVFNAAAGQDAAVGDFSQASHRAIVKVPDERVDKLSEMFSPQRTVYAEIDFLDAPGFTGKGKEAEGGEQKEETKE